MAKITFIEANGNTHTIDFQSGSTVLDVASEHNLPGIDADCGGNCGCATCHVYISDEWASLLSPPSENERSLLENANEVRKNSRLACQLELTENCDGLVVQIPIAQH